MKVFMGILCAVIFALPVYGRDMTVVVERSGDNVELYFTFPSPMMVEVFGAIPDGIIDDQDHVDFLRLQSDTVTPAEGLIEKSSARSRDQNLLMEAMSFMTHPTDIDMPFATPWDALVTTTFCSTDPNGPKRGLDAMTTYVGYFIDNVPLHHPIEVDLPWRAEDGTKIHVLEFRNKVKVSERSVALTADGKFSLYDELPNQSWFESALGWLKLK